jgi:hypothetical protein
MPPELHYRSRRSMLETLVRHAHLVWLTTDRGSDRHGADERRAPDFVNGADIKGIVTFQVV